MEYKTFRQRLFDSIREVIHRPRRVDSNASLTNNTESPLKYDSMT